MPNAECRMRNAERKTNQEAFRSAACERW